MSRRAAEHAERIRKMLQRAIDSLRQGQSPLFKKTMSANPALELYGDQPLVAVEPNGGPPTPKPEDLEIEYEGEPTEMRVVNPFVRVPAGGKAVIKIWMDAVDGYIAPGGGQGVEGVAAVLAHAQHARAE